MVTLGGGIGHGTGSVLLKLGCPSTPVALPTHTGHTRLYGSSAVGKGSWLLRSAKISTRLFTGWAPTILESATNNILLAYATPLTAPTIDWVAVSDSESNNGCPIARRAAWPVLNPILCDQQATVDTKTAIKNFMIL